MMNFLRKSLALEIENFAKHFKFFIGNAKFTGYSKSAFVQCRNKIQPEVFNPPPAPARILSCGLLKKKKIVFSKHTKSKSITQK